MGTMEEYRVSEWRESADSLCRELPERLSYQDMKGIYHAYNNLAAALLESIDSGMGYVKEYMFSADVARCVIESLYMARA